MLIGIAGSFLGTWLGRLIGHYEPDHSAGFLMSLVGALILLGIYHLIKRSQTNHLDADVQTLPPELPHERPAWGARV